MGGQTEICLTIKIILFNLIDKSNKKIKAKQ
jgi:hypothetical protein